jgi:hypothetical protein
MAKFDVSIPWSWTSNFDESMGQSLTETESGAVHTQTFFSADNRVDWNIRHTDLSHSVAMDVRDFLKDNAALEFTIEDPLSNVEYNGRLFGNVRFQPKRGNYYDVSWSFKGTEVIPP